LVMLMYTDPTTAVRYRPCGQGKFCAGRIYMGRGRRGGGGGGTSVVYVSMYGAFAHRQAMTYLNNCKKLLGRSNWGGGAQTISQVSFRRLHYVLFKGTILSVQGISPLTFSLMMAVVFPRTMGDLALAVVTPLRSPLMAFSGQGLSSAQNCSRQLPNHSSSKAERVDRVK